MTGRTRSLFAPCSLPVRSLLAPCSLPARSLRSAAALGLSALVLAALSGPAFADTSLLNTADATVPAGSAGGDDYSLDSSQWLGAAFTTTQPYTVTSLGFSGEVDSGTLFFALVPADPITLLPTSSSLSNAIYTTVFSGASVVTNFSFATSTPLATGTYDVVAGSGALGASGSGGLQESEGANGPAIFIQGNPSPFFQQSLTNTPRFFVNGVVPSITPAAVPEPGSLALLGLTLPALGVLVRRRARK